MIATLAAALAVNLLVFGLHALLPFRLAGAAPERRRAWALVALPLLLSSILLTLAGLRFRIDEAGAWGLTDPRGGSLFARIVVVLVAGALLADVVLLVGRTRVEPAAWRVAGVLGLLAALGHAFGSELLRVGLGPFSFGFVGLVAVALLRVPLALAAAELALGAPRLWTPLAGLALWAATRLWAPALRGRLAGELATLLAAALLLVLARFVPQTLRRATGAAGLLLAVVYLVRAALVSRALGGSLAVPEGLLVP